MTPCSGSLAVSVSRSDYWRGLLLRAVGAVLSMLLTVHVCSASSPQAMAGFPATCAGEASSAPVFFDLTGNGQDEIIVGTLNGYVQVMDADGSSWSTIAWPRHLPAPVAGSVAAAMDKQGNPVIMAATRDGRIFGMDVHGRDRWHIDTSTGGVIHMMGASDPVTGDLSGDGVEEAVFSSSSGRVYVVSPDGELRATYYADASVSSTPVIGDINGDGRMELIFKSDDGMVHALSGHSNIPGFPVKNTLYSGSCPFDFALADMNNDGRRSIVGSTGMVDDEYRLYMIDADGTVHDLGALPGKSPFAPLLVDLNGDGLKEVVTITVDGFLDIRHQNGESAPGFPVKKCDHAEGGVILVDVNGDGRMNLVFAGYSGEKSGTGSLYAVTLDGNMVDGYPLETGRSFNRPFAADLNNDGRLELVLLTSCGTGPSLVEVFSCDAGAPFTMIILGREFSY